MIFQLPERRWGREAEKPRLFSGGQFKYSVVLSNPGGRAVIGGLSEMRQSLKREMWRRGVEVEFPPEYLGLTLLLLLILSTKDYYLNMPCSSLLIFFFLPQLP